MSSVVCVLRDIAIKFCKKEHGVVALMYAAIAPLIILVLLMAFDAEQYNRYVTRVQQSQSVALQRARSENDTSSSNESQTSKRDRRLSFTESWVKLNSSLVNGISLKTDEAKIESIVTDITHIKDFLKIENRTDKLGMLYWAFASDYFSMRIPIENMDDRLDLCRRVIQSLTDDGDPDYYTKDVVTYCGKLSVDQIKQIPNEYRVKADQLALYNMAKGFFPGGQCMTKTELAKLLGVSSVGANSAYLMFNYKDMPNNDLSNITTNLKTDSGFGDFYYWMQEMYDKSFPGSTVQKKYAYFNDPANNLNKTRLFFSDWMLEDMSGWLNGKPGFENAINDNYRSVRAYFSFTGNYVTKVQIKVNRGFSEGVYGTHNYDLDLQVKAASEKFGTMDEEEFNNKSPDLETYTIRYIDTLWYPNDPTKKDNLHGVNRPVTQKQYADWLTEYYYRLDKSNTKIENLKDEYEGKKRTEMINAKKTELGLDSLSQDIIDQIDTDLASQIAQIEKTIHDEAYGVEGDPTKKGYNPDSQESYEKWYAMFLGEKDWLWNGTGGGGKMYRGAGLTEEEADDVACRIVYGQNADGSCMKN